MKSFLSIILILSAGWLCPLIAADSPEETLAAYRADLAACRAAHGGSYDVPDVKFFLFGMGARTKLLYRDGTLVPFTAEIDLTAGHELLFVPMMQERHEPDHREPRDP